MAEFWVKTTTGAEHIKATGYLVDDGSGALTFRDLLMPIATYAAGEWSKVTRVLVDLKTARVALPEPKPEAAAGRAAVYEVMGDDQKTFQWVVSTGGHPSIGGRVLCSFPAHSLAGAEWYADQWNRDAVIA